MSIWGTEPLLLTRLLLVKLNTEFLRALAIVKIFLWVLGAYGWFLSGEAVVGS